MKFVATMATGGRRMTLKCPPRNRTSFECQNPQREVPDQPAALSPLDPSEGKLSALVRSERSRTLKLLLRLLNLLLSRPRQVNLCRNHCRSRLLCQQDILSNSLIHKDGRLKFLGMGVEPSLLPRAGFHPSITYPKSSTAAGIRSITRTQLTITRLSS